MSRVLINGQEAGCLPADDRGLQYGDGLFETIAVSDGRLVFWREHFTRLAAGAQRLGMPVPDEMLLREEAGRLIRGKARGVLKIILTRGSGGRGYRPPEQVSCRRIVSVHPWPEYPAGNATDGVELRICRTPLSTNPTLAGIKHLNRLEQVLARNEWREEHIAEGLMLDTQGRVIEGTISNVFAVKDSKLITPCLRNCGVEGVIRGIILRMTDNFRIETSINDLRLNDLASMDELFICNSVIGIWPVRKLQQHSYRPGKVTRELQGALSAAWVGEVA